MRSEKYEFTGHNGGVLAGRLELPEEGDPLAFAVFAHCFTCSKDFVASRTIARSLAKRQIATLRFDFTGLGNSEGDFSNTNFSSNVEDLVLAAESLAKDHRAPHIMIGHSLGGAATLAAASQLPQVKAVATIGAPFDPAHIEHLLCDSLSTIEQDGEAKVDLYGRAFTIRRQFVEDIKQQNQLPRIAEIHKPLMIMHSPTDQTVNIENARLIYEAARHPKSFISLDGIDHLLTKPDDAEYVASLLAAWTSRYI